MKEITRLMINEYKIQELGYDFMGFSPQKEIYTAHHMIIPKRNGGKLTHDNTAILMQTPHQIIHKIENYDFELFSAITSEMIDMNIKGYLDEKNIYEIYYLLDYFYKEFKGQETRKGKPIITNEYQKRLVLRR